MAPPTAAKSVGIGWHPETAHTYASMRDRSIPRLRRQGMPSRPLACVNPGQVVAQAAPDRGSLGEERTARYENLASPAPRSTLIVHGRGSMGRAPRRRGEKNVFPVVGRTARRRTHGQGLVHGPANRVSSVGLACALVGGPPHRGTREADQRTRVADRSPSVRHPEAGAEQLALYGRSAPIVELHQSAVGEGSHAADSRAGLRHVSSSTKSSSPPERSTMRLAATRPGRYWPHTIWRT